MLRRLLAIVACAGTLLACSNPGPPTAGRSTGPSTSPRPSPPPGRVTDLPPDPVTAGAASVPSSGPVSGRRYVFPVDGRASYGREHHDYPAADLIAPCGAVVRAVTDGRVLEVSREDRFDRSRPVGADRGGLSVSLLGDDGVRYYGSHLSSIDAPVRAGLRVDAGTRLGLVGRTGNANNTCHLHFGLSPGCAGTGDWWIRRGVVWPWPYLDAWRAGSARSPAAEVTAWHRTNACPAPPPGA